MSESFLKNPLSLFDIKGKTAIIAGASGAFGALRQKHWPAPAPTWSSQQAKPKS